MSLECPTILPSPITFVEWHDWSTPACGTASALFYHLLCLWCWKGIHYLQIDCTVYIGTDGGKREHGDFFLWIICSPGQERLVFNSRPVDGWCRRQSSLCSEATALSSVCNTTRCNVWSHGYPAASGISSRWRIGGTKSEPLLTRNIPVQVLHRNTTITSHYVSRLRAEIGADIHHDFLQGKYN